MSEYKKEEWRVKQPAADIRALAERFSISPILAHIIVNREITEPDAVACYLSDDLAYTHDPALMKDMDKGCQIMKEKIRAGKKIRIISDYDVDGITSNYILYQGLQKAGADVSYDIPHRIMDGYGMNVRLVEAAYADGVDTIITCDNGIAAETAVTRAKELGMTVIVTDHHEVPCEVTENGEKNYLYVNADAVIDPHRPDCAYPYKDLCGAGVAYKFIRHLYRVTELPWEDEDAYMDILALGTVCDIMPLTDENRIFVKRGLRRLTNSTNLGINALKKALGLDGKPIEVHHLSFRIGPSLNSTGRLESAKEGVELLLTEANGHGETTDANILAARQRFDQLYAQYKPAVEAEAEEVRAAGGLFIIGTERHESRRIENQLRGRAGRQGDPGTTQFFLSLEDDLMRIFGSENISKFMDKLGMDEDEPITAKMITRSIEKAQKKVESHNFEIRKYVLEYDDVMNQQREIIYGQRRKVLDGEDISTEMHNMLRENIDSSCKQFLAGDVKDEWDFGALRRHYQGWLTTDADFRYTVADFDNISREGIADMLYNRGMQILQAKEVRYGAPLMRELERICLLKCVDRQWMDHIDNMDQLRQGIALRGYGQKDPVVEYRIEGFDMFDQMVDSIRESSVKMLLTIEVREAGKAPKREQVAKPTGEGYVPGNGAPGAKGAPKGQPVRVIKIGRNDPCPCGSGLKWKKCTCAKYHPEGSHTEG